MGNEVNNRQSAKSDGKHVYLALRCREIILHYSYKMKLSISDISQFPHGLQGLKLWETDIVLSRYIILQNQRFGNKTAFVLKGGIGIAGITLNKWAGCKKVDMCDTNKQVVGNMTNNCIRNSFKNLKCFQVTIDEYTKYTQKYDFAFFAAILNQGVKNHVILNIWRKVLKIGGEAIIVMPQNKQKAKEFLDCVDRQEFKISNSLLTAVEYDSSPLLNKIQGQAEFPLLGKVSFYVINLQKLKEMPLESLKKDSQKEDKADIYKTPPRQQKFSKEQQNSSSQQNKEANRQTNSVKILQSQKQISIPVTMTKTKIQQDRDESPIKKLQERQGKQQKQPCVDNKLTKVQQNQQPKSEGL